MVVATNSKMDPHKVRADRSQSYSNSAFSFIQFQKNTCAITGTHHNEMTHHRFGSFEPIIGTEVQSKELIDSLLKGQEENTENIWKSEIFGRSLDVIVQEGIQTKLSLLPESAKYKLCQTITKMVNKGSNNLIAIVI